MGPGFLTPMQEPAVSQPHHSGSLCFSWNAAGMPRDAGQLRSAKLQQPNGTWRKSVALLWRQKEILRRVTLICTPMRALRPEDSGLLPPQPHSA